MSWAAFLLDGALQLGVGTATVDSNISPWYWPVSLGVLALIAIALTSLRRRFDSTSAERALRLLRGLGVLFVLGLVSLHGLGVDSRHWGYRLVATGLWTVAIYAGVTLVRTWFIRARAADEGTDGAAVPRLLVDLITFTMITVGVSIALANVWDQSVANLVTALGLGSVVIGLALQDTLGNLFSGVALMTERPYVIGDWIVIDGLEGRVVEVNWRAVHLMTRDDDLVIFPNSVVASAKLINEVKPSAIQALRFNLGFSYDDPPNKVKFMLRRAAVATRGVLHDPAPTIRTISYDDFAIQYEVRLFINDHVDRPNILDRFHTRIWYSARRNGITIPFPIRRIYHEKVQAAPPPPEEDLIAYLRRVPIFEPLSDSDLSELSETAQRLEWGHGEHIVREGEEGDAMYVLIKGDASVVIGETPSDPGEAVGSLNAGDFFGEMAALTGEPRTASVVANSDLEALAVLPDDLRGVLSRQPDLAEAMAEIVETRRASLEDKKAAATESKGAAAEQLSAKRQLANKIRGFLGL